VADRADRLVALFSEYYVPMYVKVVMNHEVQNRNVSFCVFRIFSSL
jgi:hypothetical protein